MKKVITNPNPGDDRQQKNTVICLVSNYVFNNELLSNYLASKTGARCHCAQPTGLTELWDALPDQETLLILDCASMRESKACEISEIRECLRNRRIKVICYNVSRLENLEIKAFRKGIRGLLYDDLPIDQYPRAIEAVLGGHLWYPRNTMEKLFLNSEQQKLPLGDEVPVLTAREKEILQKLAEGLGNHDIARKLCISPHTVKTHAYNIYKKINVANRFQAARWLIENG
jgi:LuxR family transcriptional regulator of csgAB operon